MYRQFDRVELLTTRGITWLSDRPGQMPSPHGEWSITGIVDGDLLLAKETCLIRVPAINVKKVAEYDVSKIFEQLEKVKDGIAKAPKSIGGGNS